MLIKHGAKHNLDAGLTEATLHDLCVEVGLVNVTRGYEARLRALREVADNTLRND